MSENLMCHGRETLNFLFLCRQAALKLSKRKHIFCISILQISRFCTKESCSRPVLYTLDSFSFKKQKNTSGKS